MTRSCEESGRGDFLSFNSMGNDVSVGGVNKIKITMTLIIISVMSQFILIQK